MGIAGGNHCHCVCTQALALVEGRGGKRGGGGGGDPLGSVGDQPVRFAAAVMPLIPVCLLQCKQSTHAIAAGRHTGPAAASGWLPPCHSNPACCARCGCAAAGTAQHDVLHAFLLDCPIYGGPSAGIAPGC